MKKLLLFLPFLLIVSCSVQKRKYQNGFYVDWHSKTPAKETYASKSSKKTHTAPTPVAVREEKQEVAQQAIPELHFNRHAVTRSIKTPQAAPEDTCDVLVFKDGSEIKGKVKEIGSSEIKYKRCDSPDGPTYISKSSDIFMVKYANGTREVIKSEPTPRVQSPEPLRNRPNTNENSDYRKNSYSRQVHPAALASLIFAVLALVVLYAGALFTTGALAVFIIPLLFAILAIITGIVGMRKIREQPDVYKGKGLAMTGMIMGMVFATIYFFILFILLLLLGI